MSDALRPQAGFHRSQSIPAKASSHRNEFPEEETGSSRSQSLSIWRKPAPVGANPPQLEAGSFSSNPMMVDEFLPQITDPKEQLGGGLSHANEPLLDFHTTPTTHC